MGKMLVCNKKITLFAIAVLSFIIILPAISSSAEIYKFERMWPTLQQPWYFNAAAGVAIDHHGYIYIADTNNGRIRKFNADGQFITQWGKTGGYDNEFYFPHSLAVDRNGDIYVGDTGGINEGTIKKFSSDGQFITKWGSFQAGSTKDGALYLAIDNRDHVYVVEPLTHSVHKFSLNGDSILSWGGFGTDEGKFNVPTCIATDVDGNLYVSDTGNDRIQKFDANGNFITQWAVPGSGGTITDGPSGIAVDGSGIVCVLDGPNWRIQIFDANGVFIENWDLLLEQQFAPWGGLAIDKNGSLYFADAGAHRILKLNPDGQLMTFWSSWGSGEGQFLWPGGIAIDASGNIYVADEDNNRIQKFDSNGAFIKSWGPDLTDGKALNDPLDVAVDGSGNVYSVELFYHRVQKFDSDGNPLTLWGSNGTGPGQFNAPEAITVDSNGYVYVADTWNHRIQKFNSDGVFIWEKGSLGTDPGKFNYPRDIAVDKDGYVYVADQYNGRVQKLDTNGNFVLQWDEVDSVHGITTDDDGYIYASSSYSGHIRKLTSDGTLITSWGDHGSDPGQIQSDGKPAVSPDGNLFYVPDKYNNRVQVFKRIAVNPNSKAVVLAGGGPFAGNNLWDATQMCANFAYRALTFQGFTKDTIYYLTSDTALDLDGNGELDDVDADATNSNLQQAITTWAADAEELVVYLVDHGGDGTFRMGASETLAASDLDTWLDQLQALIAGTVTVIYDACESGSFLTALTPPAGKDRIVITSTSPSESAYFVTQGSVSFSNFFWTHVFNGVNVKDAFDLSSQAIGYATDYQHPLIDANGNGLGNESADLTLVQSTYIGNGTVNQGEVPQINEVSAPQTIVDVNSALLYADGVTDEDGIARVWAVIRPPDYSAGSATNPVQELPSIDLMPVSESRFEATYDGFSIEGTYQIAVYARDRIGNTSIPKLATVNVNNPLRRKAIIVAGGPESDELWPAVQANAWLVYETLIFQGYSDDDIYFLSPLSFSSGVDVLATLSNLNFAIGSWAAANCQDVVIYLVGRGGVNSFQMNATETLIAADLDTWLDNLQNSLPGKVTIIYDASHSGSFLSLLSPPPDKERIVVSSATASQSANFASNGDISFSTFFWQQVSNGANVRDAFVHGVNAIGFAAGGQTPLLDDSGNGIGNELGIDGRDARDYTIGVGIILAGDAPVIGSVSSAQTLSGQLSAMIWADDVTSSAAIDRVWAVITPPDYDANQSGGSNPVSINLTAAGAGRYEATYSNFNLFGIYQIAMYAMDVSGSLSLPAATTVEQGMGTDHYESDDSYLEATVIQLNGAAPQRHNFHDAGDQDWVKFNGISGEVYEVKISDVGSRADVVIELFDTDGTTSLQGPWSIGFEGEGELMNWVCAADGTYYVMVWQQDASIFGSDTGYDLEIYRPIGPGGGWVQGMISDFVTGLPLSGVQVSTSGGASAISLTNGAYIMIDAAGIYTVIAEMPGYSLGSFTDVSISEYGVTTCNFILAPGDSDSDGIPDEVENTIACLDANDDDTDDDGILDGNEDTDHDGVVDDVETDPCDEDTDGDGLQDGTEIGLTAPQGTDTDPVTFIPDDDPSTTTDPLDDDTDNDGWLDGEEDTNHNGRVDEGEKDPNQSDAICLPHLPLLLL